MENDSSNPYRPPETIPASLPASAFAGTEFVDASHGLRFANFIIDQIVIQVTVVVMAGIFGFLYALLNPESPQIGEQELTFVAYLLTILIHVSYYLLMEGLFGRSLGKLATGTRVIDRHGNKPSFSRVLGRSLCRFIPFEQFSFLGAPGNGWHDSISKTRVIKIGAVPWQPPVPAAVAPPIPGKAPVFRQPLVPVNPNPIQPVIPSATPPPIPRSE